MTERTTLERGRKRVDRVYVSPGGERFRSLPQAQAYAGGDRARSYKTGRLSSFNIGEVRPNYQDRTNMKQDNISSAIALTVSLSPVVNASTS